MTWWGHGNITIEIGSRKDENLEWKRRKAGGKQRERKVDSERNNMGQLWVIFRIRVNEIGSKEIETRKNFTWFISDVEDYLMPIVTNPHLILF